MRNCIKVNLTFIFQPNNRSSVEKLLKSVKTSKAACPDIIPPRMIKDAYKELTYSLYHLINENIKTGIFPTGEKVAKVTPIYKSEAHLLFDNNRPVSVLNISKIVEKVIVQQITTYFENDELLYKHQYGFRKNKCIQDAVIYLHDHIHQEMNRKNVTGGLYIDLRKVFVTASHSCLLSKLPYYGLCGIELIWITDYLFNRTQHVAFNHDRSNLESVTLGVPQRSILGPLLFIILVNDAYQSLNKCSMSSYADDTVLLYSASSSKLIEETLNHEGNILFDWFNNNNLILILKPGKTELVIYGTPRNLPTQPKCNVELKGSKINYATHNEYLGISLDQNLTMTQQTTKIYKTINQRLKQQL